MSRITLLGVVLLFTITHLHAQQADKKKDEPKTIDPKKLKEVAGSAEFLRDVPKHFAVLKAVDLKTNQVTIHQEGEAQPKTWSLVPDAEVKVMGWWGRLNDFTLGDRVWVWFKTDRKKMAVAVCMIADEISQQDINGVPLTVKNVTAVIKGDGPPNQAEFEAGKGKLRVLDIGRGRLDVGEKYFVQSAAGANDKTPVGARLVLTAKELEAARQKQKLALRERWAKDGLPGTIGFVHVFSGEMDLILDHETMRWARSMQLGDKVTLRADPPIKGLVKNVTHWRERTMVRLVVKSHDLADLASGQRLHLLRTPPPVEIDTAVLPPDIDGPRSTKQERIDWFLANIYCTCGVAGDRCTGHFYTLASCNPNACGMPNHMRNILGEKIEAGKTDRQIYEELITRYGPTLLKPHLLP